MLDSLSAGASTHSHLGPAASDTWQGALVSALPLPQAQGPGLSWPARLSSPPAETRLGPGGRSTLSQPQAAQRQGWETVCGHHPTPHQARRRLAPDMSRAGTTPGAPGAGGRHLKGSDSCTSRAAPRIRPSFRAWASAFSSTRPPRAVFTRKAPCLIWEGQTVGLKAPPR